MNMQQIINMLTRMVMRRGMSWGINKATRQMSKTSAKQPGSKGATPTGHQQNRAAREAAKRARQAAQITRRLGR